MVEGDSGGGESLLDGGVDAVGVAVSGDRDGAAVVHFDKCGTDVLSDFVWVTPFRHLTVLYVPPHRRFRRYVLRFR